MAEFVVGVKKATRWRNSDDAAPSSFRLVILGGAKELRIQRW